MTEKLSFSLVSPEREVFSGEVDHVVVPGSEGEFGVSPAHAPVMSVVKPGALRIYNDGAERRVFVNGGFADVTPDGLTILVEEALDLSDMDASKLDQELRSAQEDLRDAASEERRDGARRALARLETIKAALSR
jgi:F-type H+-transporting ATPase subunit epsilon